MKQLAAAGAYVIVALMATAMAARSTAVRDRHDVDGETAAVVARRRLWVLVAFCFIGFAAWRLFGIDDLLRRSYRDNAAITGDYDHRYVLQAALIIAIVLSMILGVVVIDRQLRKQALAADRLALVLIVVFIAFFQIRVVSVHAIDQLLYRSILGINLNRVVDSGLTIAIGALTITAIRRRLPSNWLKRNDKNPLRRVPPDGPPKMR